MFIDLNEIDEGAELEADLCIIGTGPAGISIALELLGSGLTVALVESGGFDFDPDVQDLNLGEVAGIPYLDLDSTRLRYLGGTSNHWAGQSRPLDPWDFETRDWVPDSGWPITAEEFAAYLPRAETRCRLTTEAATDPIWDALSDGPDFPLSEGGFQPVLLRYPDPVFSFGTVYRRTIAAAHQLQCYLHANVVRIDSDAAGRRVQSLQLASLQGRRATMRAPHVVLAAGGIENSRILLASGAEGEQPGEGPGLGNAHDVVGRYFMEHPNFFAGEIEFEAEGPYLTEAQTRFGDQEVRLDAQLGPEEQQAEAILNHSVFATVPRARNRGRLARLWTSVVGDDRPAQLRVRLEHAPHAESRVTLADESDAFGVPRPRLSLEMGELETRTISVVAEAYARALGMAELGRMRVDFDPSGADWASEAGWQYHHCGGTRMHADPRKGVVDADGRVHGMENLYVAGSSVFPTSGHTNPTLNLVALAIRLGDHLKRTIVR